MRSLPAAAPHHASAMTPFSFKKNVSTVTPYDCQKEQSRCRKRERKKARLGRAKRRRAGEHRIAEEKERSGRGRVPAWDFRGSEASTPTGSSCRQSRVPPQRAGLGGGALVEPFPRIPCAPACGALAAWGR